MAIDSTIAPEIHNLAFVWSPLISKRRPRCDTLLLKSATRYNSQDETYGASNPSFVFGRRKDFVAPTKSHLPLYTLGCLCLSPITAIYIKRKSEHIAERTKLWLIKSDVSLEEMKRDGWVKSPPKNTEMGEYRWQPLSLCRWKDRCMVLKLASFLSEAPCKRWDVTTYIR